MDLINVIIPCYNYSSYLDLCLMSVFTQRVNCKVEILLSDDNSSDESFGIAERISMNYNNDNISLKVFKQENNLGEIANTKFLLEKCTGKYIAYLDADDYWIDPYKLQRQYDFMEKNPDYSICSTGSLIFDGVNHMPCPTSKEAIIAPLFYITNQRELLPEDLVETNYIFSSSRFFKNYKGLFKEYFYKFPFTDWPMNFELSLLGRVGYVDYASYIYRLKKDSLCTKENKKLTDEEQLVLNNQRIKILKDRLLESKMVL